MNKIAQNDHEIHDLLRTRWSPRSFSPQPVEAEQLLSLFEAARWAPSGNNRQPWSFIVTHGQTPEAYGNLLGTLNERNQAWAKTAPVLVLAIAQIEPEPGKANPFAIYDLGQAVAHLSIQASALGLSVHQIGGFDRVKAEQIFELPTGYQPVTVFAMGFPGDPQVLPEGFRAGETAPRDRKPLSDFAYQGKWQQPLTEQVHSLN